MYDAPHYAWILVLIGAIGIPALTAVALARAAALAGLGCWAVGVAVAFGAALGGWLALSALLARAGAYQDGLVVAMATVFVALLLATRIPVVARLLAQPGAIAWFTLPHALRVVGIVFLLLLAQGYLPAGFAVPAGLGDLAVGLAAPFVAWGLARSTPGVANAWAAWFHCFGLLDLSIAVFMAFVFSPGGLVPSAPSTAALTLLPLALNATVVVPLALVLHLVSLRQLRAAVRRDAAVEGWQPTGQPGPARS